MNVLWTAKEAAEVTRGVATCDWSASGVSIDTRTLAAGDLFVALTDVRDGHDFVAQALKSGAAAALVSHRPEGLPSDAPLLIVDDVLRGLERLAKAARARTKAKVIAITGSVGKTSTKDMLAHVLAHQGRTHQAVMSLNNHWGVPLTLARMPADSDFAVIEIGMNHAGEITPLTKLVGPHVALVTTVGDAHMEAFGSIEAIAHAKAEIFEGMAPSGIAILNHDDATYEILRRTAVEKGAGIISFGRAPNAEFRVEAVTLHNAVTTVSASVRGEALLFKIGAAGRHLAMNAMAVLATLETVDADLAVAALDLASWHPPEGRGQRSIIHLDAIEDSLCLELIDDAYNANPTSMAAAFDVLAAATPIDGIGRIRRGRRIAFLSDMLELGEDGAKKHAAIAELASMEKVDLVHCAGPLMKNLHAALPAEKRGDWHQSAEPLAARVHHLLDAGDVVMVKGSKGSRASLVVDAIKKLGQATPNE